jgi:hypothetical protein
MWDGGNFCHTPEFHARPVGMRAQANGVPIEFFFVSALFYLLSTFFREYWDFREY